MSLHYEKGDNGLSQGCVLCQIPYSEYSYESEGTKEDILVSGIGFLLSALRRFSCYW